MSRGSPVPSDPKRIMNGSPVAAAGLGRHAVGSDDDARRRVPPRTAKGVRRISVTDLRAIHVLDSSPLHRSLLMWLGHGNSRSRKLSGLLRVRGGSRWHGTSTPTQAVR